jgi:glutamate/tyrosine decarboxylase-like PLP-dependent enzyme
MKILQRFIERRLAKPGLHLPMWLQRWLLSTTMVKNKIAAEQDKLLEEMGDRMNPYKGKVRAFPSLPAEGLPRTEILKELWLMKDLEEATWRDGYVSGAVYHGDREHTDFLNEVYALYSQGNPLHHDLWPSLAKMEAEIVSMAAHLLGGDADTCGVVSSGGTESILLAVKTYRDWAANEKGITKPELVVPVTAHAAFEKAAEYFNIHLIRIPVMKDFRADPAEARRAITRNTIALVGSAPSFPHGTIDPIVELSEIAQERGIGFHTDACLGGFVLPWAKKLGYNIPEFDFTLPGVTSISADTHKFGYAAKGTSTVLYRRKDLLHYQYFTSTDWPGGLYASPTFAGSRPGGLSAACWASLVSLGEEGYLKATRAILETAAIIRREVEKIPEIRILGDPLWVLAFASDTLDIYRVLHQMTQRGWNLNALQRPPAFHLCVTLRHTQPGVAERFVGDLRSSVEHVKANLEGSGESVPIYGMAATFPLRGAVSELLKRYLDGLYRG